MLKSIKNYVQNTEVQGLTLRTVLLSGTSINCTRTSKVQRALVLGQEQNVKILSIDIGP